MDPTEWYQKFMADSDDEEPILFKDEGFKKSADPNDRQAQPSKNIPKQSVEFDSKSISSFSGQALKPTVDLKGNSKLEHDSKSDKKGYLGSIDDILNIDADKIELSNDFLSAYNLTKRKTDHSKNQEATKAQGEPQKDYSKIFGTKVKESPEVKSIILTSKPIV